MEFASRIDPVKTTQTLLILLLMVYVDATAQNYMMSWPLIGLLWAVFDSGAYD